MKHILILNGNPDPKAERLSHALCRAYHEGAEEPGAMVRHINVGGVEFPMLHDAAEFGTEPSEPAVEAAQGAFLTADHIVFVYPLWLGGPPALLKRLYGTARAQQLSDRQDRTWLHAGPPKGPYRPRHRHHGNAAPYLPDGVWRTWRQGFQPKHSQFGRH